MNKLIAISGKKQTGKSTIARIIQAIDIYYQVKNDPVLTTAAKFNIYNQQIFTNFVKECVFDNGFVRLQSNYGLYPEYTDNMFAWKLKFCLSRIFDITPSAFEDNNIKNSPSPVKKPTGDFYTWRELLQLFGTEVGRAISPNFWVDALFSEYNPEVDSWVICDTRFKTEAEAIKERNGLLIRVNRNTGLVDNHQSEIDLDDYQDFDVVIDNNGTVDELIEKVHQIMLDYNIIQ